MIFANAIYLWGLLGLLIPIAIHLWSRKKVKTIKVGSTKLLEASEPKQTSSIKLSELWLLFLRLLTILLLVFILSEPSITTKEEGSDISYLIESSLMNDEKMRSILDTIPKESVRILERGFPKWEDYDFEGFQEEPLYWQLAQKMESIPSDSIVVFSRGFTKGLRGKRPRISANTRWMVVGSSDENQKVIEVRNKESYAEVLSVSTDNNSLFFEKDSISLTRDVIEFNSKRDSIRLLKSNSKDWMMLQKRAPIQIGIFENDSLNNQVQFIKAAYGGISKFLNWPIEIETLDDTIDIEGFDTLISFDNMISLNTDTNVIIYQPDKFAEDLIAKSTTKNVFHLTKLLDSENIVSEHLPEKLLNLLNLHKGIEEVIELNDARTVDEDELQPIKSTAKPIKNIASMVQITPWIWMVLILTVIAERILSKLRKQ